MTIHELFQQKIVELDELIKSGAYEQAFEKSDEMIIHFLKIVETNNYQTPLCIRETATLLREWCEKNWHTEDTNVTGN